MIKLTISTCDKKIEKKTLSEQSENLTSVELIEEEPTQDGTVYLPKM